MSGKVEVTQEDSDAAAKFYRPMHGRRLLATNIKDGYVDDDKLVQAFARHRITASQLQHVAYFDEGEFHWMTGIAPRDCELYAKWKA